MVQMILARRTDIWNELEDTSAGVGSNLLRFKLSLILMHCDYEFAILPDPVTTAVCHRAARHCNQFLP
jgi:hypothetical protein